MNDLIKALQIFAKYADEKWPTNCSHDELAIMGIHIDDVSDEDVARLKELDFIWAVSDEYFYSFRFGSA
jgi:hypothetical protein